MTLDAGFDAERLVPLLEPGPFRVQRWTSSDIAADADNDWGDAAVVDGHVHMGWQPVAEWRLCRTAGPR